MPAGQAFAAKIIDKRTLLRSKTKQKLTTEIKIHKSLDHKYIVKFFSFFEDKNNVYILLEICRCRVSCNNNQEKNTPISKTPLVKITVTYRVTKETHTDL